jgi:hypothetical protein
MAMAACLACASAASAVEPPANLEAALNGALQNHPDLVAAQMKINQARAEYDSIRLEVVRKTVAAYGAVSMKRLEIERLKQQLTMTPDVAERAETERQLIGAQAILEQLTTELHYMTHYTGGQALTSNTPAAESLHLEPDVPQSAVAKRTAELLARPMTAEFIDTPLKDVIEYLKLSTGASIMMHADVDREKPITLNLKQVSLFGVLQAIEDATNDRFMMRNYGMLLVPEYYVGEMVPVGKYVSEYLGIDQATAEAEQEAKSQKKKKE